MGFPTELKNAFKRWLIGSASNGSGAKLLKDLWGRCLTPNSLPNCEESIVDNDASNNKYEGADGQPCKN